MNSKCKDAIIEYRRHEKAKLKHAIGFWLSGLFTVASIALLVACAQITTELNPSMLLLKLMAFIGALSLMLLFVYFMMENATEHDKHEEALQ